MRQKLILTITLTGPENTPATEVSRQRNELRQCRIDLQDMAEELAEQYDFVPEFETQHLQQQDDALWETVGREGS